jgi:hypothetical protein
MYIIRVKLSNRHDLLDLCNTNFTCGGDISVEVSG